MNKIIFNKDCIEFIKANLDFDNMINAKIDYDYKRDIKIFTIEIDNTKARKNLCISKKESFLKSLFKKIKNFFK